MKPQETLLGRWPSETAPVALHAHWVTLCLLILLIVTAPPPTESSFRPGNPNPRGADSTASHHSPLRYQTNPVPFPNTLPDPFRSHPPCANRNVPHHPASSLLVARTHGMPNELSPICGPLLPQPYPPAYRPPTFVPLSCFRPFLPIRLLRHPIRGVRHRIMLNCRPIPMSLVCACLAFPATPDGKTQKAGDEQILFGDLPTVEAAALHAQTLAEAPANVRVITAADIRHYGYRTLAEALASVRGFYATYDHTYHYMGVGGVSLPGDFNTRFLVMLNGHPLTDNIYNSNGFFGQDFGLDMDLVERIEIIRGPTSALYGSNGVLANINIVTRSPVDADRLRASAETDSAGERKLSLAASMNLGHGANLLISASVFNNLGVPFATGGLAVLPGTASVVPNADGKRGYHTFANLIWHNWSFIAYFNSRLKQTPIGVGTSFNGDPAQHAVDGRSALGALYKRSAGPGQLLWQIFYDRYRYQDRYDYPGGYPENAAVDTVRDFNFGDWIDSQLAYSLPVPQVGPLTDRKSTRL